MEIKKILTFLLLFTFITYPAKYIGAEENSQESFNPNYIISDAEMLDADSMTLAEIQDFLKAKNSFLATYSCPNAYGVTKTAAEIIYDTTHNNYDCDGSKLIDKYNFSEVAKTCTPIKTVNPKLLLVLLQKEMSLIEDDSPTNRQLDFAAGYGCPDSAACSNSWKGFGKQVNSAALQFKDYLDNPNYYKYKAGQTYTFTNPYSVNIKGDLVVTPANQATAALYNYTPHVYNGNFNFYNLWKKYFTRVYPDGSLLQAQGEVGVWLIQGGKKRPFISKGALTSRFDEKKIIIVNKSDLDNYAKGAPVKFSNYSLIRSPKGNIFLLVDDTKRGFDSKEAFKNIGFNPEEVMDASWEDINAYVDGKPLTATSTYPTGALLQDKKTGGVYWVIDGQKAPILDKIFLTTKFKNKKITPVSTEELDKYEKIQPYLFGDGELLKTPNSSGVYLISNGNKRPFASGEAFESLGYKWNNIITVPSQVLYNYALGEPITIKN